MIGDYFGNSYLLRSAVQLRTRFERSRSAVLRNSDEESLSVGKDVPANLEAQGLELKEDAVAGYFERAARGSCSAARAAMAGMRLTGFDSF